MKDQKRTRREQPLSETPDVPVNDPWQSPLGPEYVGMDCSISGAEQRWVQILTWVYVKLSRNCAQVWPYSAYGAEGCTEDWAPRYGTENVEADRLQDVLAADRAETIEAVLEKWATTLEGVFHLRTKEDISAGRKWAKDLFDDQHEKRNSYPIVEAPHIAIQCYALKCIVLQRDRETCELVQKGQKMVKGQAKRRDIKSSRCRAKWQEWQEWIDAKMKSEGWSFGFAQRKAVDKFGCSLKTMKRRTTEKRTD